MRRQRPRERTRSAELLRRCVREHEWDAPVDCVAELAGGVDVTTTIAAGRHHAVSGCVALTLAASGVRGPLTDSFSSLRDELLANRLRNALDLASVAAALDQAGVPWLLFKGPVLGEVVYSRPDLRDSLDLDVLVPPARFADALDALEGAGMPLLDPRWDWLRQHHLGEVSLVAPLGTVVDLHWSLVNWGYIRAQLSIDTDGVFARARVVSIGTVRVQTLDPVDTFVYVALHACLHGGDRLVWLKDLEQSARCGPAWHEVAARASEWRAGPAVAAMTVPARRALGAPIPRELDRSLATPGWRATVTAMDTMMPAERSAGRGTVATLVRRSAHGRATDIAGEALRRAAEWIARRGWTDESFDPERFSGSGTTHDAHDDEQARRRYLGAVAAAADA